MGGDGRELGRMSDGLSPGFRPPEGKVNLPSRERKIF